MKKIIIAIIGLTFILCLMISSVHAVMTDEKVSQDKLTQGRSIKIPEYIEGDVLVKFKEDIDPQSALEDIQIKPRSIERVHSTEEPIKKIKIELPLKNKLNSSYLVQGKTYQAIEEIPDETLFKEAYQSMEPIEKSLYRVYKIKLSPELSTEEAVAELQLNSDIEYAEPNYIFSMDYVPNDSRYSEQWSHTITQAEAGWNIERGEPSVVIAIVDSGVDYNHEDLSANIWRDASNNPGKDFVDIDTQEYIGIGCELVPGEDYTTIDYEPMDYTGHGTHCAGIAAAVGGNHLGVIGVADRCKIMPVRAGFSIIYDGSEVGALETDDIVNAIKYAADNGARVISMSFGSRNDSSTLKSAIDYVYSKNVVLVAAAGNDYSSVENYPAAYSNVIAVAATTNEDTLAHYSNWGDWVDVAAPGDEILSTVPKIGTLSDPSGYMYLSGTSMATPYVAGLAGLVISKKTSNANDFVRKIIQYSCDDIGEPGIGYGRVNVYKAVKINDINIALQSPLTDTFIRGIVNITGSAFVDGGFQGYELSRAPKNNPQNNTVIISSTTPIQSGLLGTWNTIGTPDGEYVLTLKIIITGGEFKKSINITIDNINEPPIFVKLHDKGAVLGRLLKFMIEANDPDDPQTPQGHLTYSCANLPPGAKFDPETKFFTWQPKDSDKGTYENVTFTARDNQTTITQVIKIATV